MNNGWPEPVHMAPTEMGPDDEWINLENGTLHRGECHTAVHFLENRSKELYSHGTVNVYGTQWRDPVGNLAVDHRRKIAPLGVGFGYTRKCKVCKPRGDE